MPIRFMFQQPEPQPPFIANEVHPNATISLAPTADAPFGVCVGSFGKIAAIPEDATHPGTQLTNETFAVKLDAAAQAAILSELIRLAKEQGVGGAAADTTVRID
jgi:hypothetical protein